MWAKGQRGGGFGFVQFLLNMFWQGSDHLPSPPPSPHKRFKCQYEAAKVTEFKNSNCDKTPKLKGKLFKGLTQDL